MIFNHMALKKRKFNTFKRIFFKLTILALVFLFAVQPIAPVLAVSKDRVSIKPSVPIELGDKYKTSKTIEPEVNLESPATDIKPPVINVEVQPKDKIKNPNKGNARVIELSEPSEPADITENIITPDENLPDGSENTGTEQDAEQEPIEAALVQEEIQQPPGYSTKQNFPEIDKNTGALNYNFSISVPPGRNNFQSGLSLSYNSNSNSENSIFGYGWSLNIPYIQRLNKNGSDKLYDPEADSYFYSSLDGELVFAGTDSSFIPKTEGNSIIPSRIS